jgi:hypothetical protein
MEAENNFSGVFPDEVTIFSCCSFWEDFKELEIQIRDDVQEAEMLLVDG